MKCSVLFQYLSAANHFWLKARQRTMQLTSLMKIQVLTKAMRVPSGGRVSRIGGCQRVGYPRYGVRELVVDLLRDKGREWGTE